MTQVKIATELVLLRTNKANLADKLSSIAYNSEPTKIYLQPTPPYIYL